MQHLTHAARAWCVNQVTYTGAEMDALMPAWAVTVHKAQGSEFPAVALLLHPGARGATMTWQPPQCRSFARC